MNFSLKQITGVALSILLLILLISFSGRIGEDVGAGEIVVIQDPIDGELHVYTQPGWKYQNFGSATHYRKSTQFWFSKSAEDGSVKDQSIPVKWNDGGHSTISGSARWDMPIDEQSIIAIHSTFNSQDAIEQQLIRTIIEKSVYMTGPLMTSKESYAEKRNDLIFYIEDQASKGVYKTISKETKTIDPMTLAEKTVTLVGIVKNEKGIEVRQEQSPLLKYHINLYNLSINSIDYDANVEKQIAAQQNATMQVQTAIAKSKEAEQKALTVAKEGEAEAMKAKWDQEIIKAQMVTEAEQKKEVAQLAMQEAEFYKKEQILRGEGDAARKKLEMTADGALDKKIAAYIEVNKNYASAISNYQGNWVPSVMMGTGDSKSSGGGYNGANALINMLNAKTASDLALDLGMKKK